MKKNLVVDLRLRQAKWTTLYVSSATFMAFFMRNGANCAMLMSFFQSKFMVSSNQHTCLLPNPKLNYFQVGSGLLSMFMSVFWCHQSCALMVCMTSYLFVMRDRSDDDSVVENSYNSLWINTSCSDEDEVSQIASSLHWPKSSYIHYCIMHQ